MKKPKGMTSHDVVDEVRKITGEKRVGHAGTLDPFATGVLIVAVGREDTKKLGEITKNTKKEYIATLELGKTSTTGDPEGQISLVSLSYPRPTSPGRSPGGRAHLSEIKDTLKFFMGEIMQTPPSYSAIKVQGVPAYKLARRGENVVLASRKAHIHKIEMLKYSPPLLKIRVICSAGTYIRSLAQDIGEKLGIGAYLTDLERTRVGNYRIEDSIPLAKLNAKLNPI